MVLKCDKFNIGCRKNEVLFAPCQSSLVLFGIMAIYSTVNFSFHKLCLIFNDFAHLISPKFQERLLMLTASPKFVFWGPKKKNSFVLNKFVA